MPVILGFRADGRPIWSFSGGAPDGDEGGGDDGGDQGDPVDETAVGDDGLTAGGRKALQDERTARREATRELRGWTNAMKAAGITTPEELATRLGSANGKPVDPEAIRREAEAAADKKANVRVAKATVTALATKSFASPKDALMNFGEDEWEDFLTRSGDPDERAIEDRLKDILAANPHYAAKSSGLPDFEGGARQTASGTINFDDVIRQQSRNKRGIR